MIKITEDIFIDEGSISIDFIRSSGPGGQNVNKVSSAVQLRFDTSTSGLPADMSARLQTQAKNRINEKGELIIDANRHRSQERNRQDAIDRLVSILAAAARKPKPRLKTRPSRASKERRLAEKRRRSETKKNRRDIPYK
jgi:ribosome-associated protein